MKLANLVAEVERATFFRADCVVAALQSGHLGFRLNTEPGIKPEVFVCGVQSSAAQSSKKKLKKSMEADIKCRIHNCHST